ncbi:MAG: hypothetical protein CAPSK01_004880 [Candidatus Accumulibacter vicinus]|uniref:Uncharacterized protein n=1 Tax=Candidatus Accumulibacter vicinus TaxID=2954382 RepID=A0A084XU93_9PROT|nr:MAG: hypothetical protein CAPSK01_004880 [Candidatus Accumulibacter vicinus]
MGSANLSRLKVITHVKEVDMVLASRTELTLHLIFNPNCAVTQSMDRAALVEAGRYRQPQDVGSCGCGIAQGDREGGRYFASTSDHRQLAFFPEQVACLASILRTIIAGLSRFYHRNHVAVDFGDQRQRLLRRASFGRHVRNTYPAGVIFCDRCRRSIRNVDPVMLANLLPNLGKRNVSTKIGDGPLQPFGISPARNARLALKGPAQFAAFLCPVGLLFHRHVTERASPVQFFYLANNPTPCFQLDCSLICSLPAPVLHDLKPHLAEFFNRSALGVVCSSHVP